MGQVMKGGHLSESVFDALFRRTTKAQAGHLPEAVYNALPHVYLWAVLPTVALLRNWIAIGSGLAWLSAAGIVWTLRHRCHSAFNRSGGHIDLPEAPNGDGLGGVLVQISGRPAFECGHSVIDAQHRRLFGLGNKLIKAASTNKLPGDIERLLEELVDHSTKEDLKFSRAG